MCEENKVPLRILFQQAPIVPAIRRPEHLDLALKAYGKVVFLLTGNPENCEPMIRQALDAGKIPFVRSEERRVGKECRL